jgi:hypothetical protein
VLGPRVIASRYEDSLAGVHQAPVPEERYDQWSMYAINPSERPIVGQRFREWTAFR